MMLLSPTKNQPLRTLAVKLLRAVHVWTGRRYQRALLRQEMGRIGRTIITAPRHASQPEAETTRRRRKALKPT